MPTPGRGDHAAPTDVGEVDLARVQALHDAWAPLLEGPSTVDDATWRDLDLGAFLSRVARGCSQLAQLRLFGWLRAPATSPGTLDLLPPRRAVPELPEGSAPRARFLQALRALPPVPLLLLEVITGRTRLPSLGWTPHALTALAVFSPLGFLLSLEVGAGCVGAMFVVNVLYRIRAHRTVGAAMASLSFLFAALRAADALARPSGPKGHGRLARLFALTRSLRRLSSALAELNLWPVFDVFPGEYVRVLLLNDERRLSRSVALIEAHRGELGELLLLLGELEAALAVEALVAARGGCVAELSPAEGGLTAEELRHPLIETGAVGNDLRLCGGLVVTGSNMSGKSTFLRAVALNALLAQSLGWADARRYRAPLLRVATALRNDDQLLTGESYYQAEALRLRSLLELAHQGGAFVAIDEPFRGTNSVERIAAATAVARELRRAGAWVLLATHDGELGRLLRADYGEAHFTDHCTPGGLAFDYRLRPGPAATRNAIHLLSVLGYPSGVTEEAARLVGTLEPS